MANIVTGYKWTTVTGSILNEAPRIFANTFKVDDNDILNAIQNWFSIGTSGKGGKEYYNQLHKATKKEDWVFPFFGDEVRQFSNSWEDSYVGSTNGTQIAGAQITKAAAELASAVIQTKETFAAMFSKSPGSLFEPPKFYQYDASDGPVTVEFTLINTDSEEAPEKNYNLVQQLIKENRFTRAESGLAVTPPYLWSVTVPGYRAIRWASCAVSVSMLGMRKLVDNRLTPEGYRVSLTFTSLYTEPSNFMDATSSALGG